MRKSMNNESDHDSGPQKPSGGNFGAWMAVGFWILLLSFVSIAAKQHLDKRMAADPPLYLPQATGSGPAVAINGSRRGHYRVQGFVNGQTVDFLVDTGATEVSIPSGVAERLNLRRGTTGLARTANGTVTIYDTTIDTLSIGPLSLSNVAANINPGMQGNEALLGMSFLRHFTLVQKGSQLQIQTP